MKAISYSRYGGPEVLEYGDGLGDRVRALAPDSL
jgi:hypothetical protein